VGRGREASGVGWGSRSNPDFPLDGTLADFKLCFFVGGFSPSSPQSFHSVFAPSELVFPPASHRALCYSMVYIKTVKKKTKSVEKKFTWLRLV